MGHFDSISCKRNTIQLTLLLTSNLKSPIGFRLTYLHLSLVHYKGQSRRHANFDCDSNSKIGADMADIIIAI